MSRIQFTDEVSPVQRGGWDSADKLHLKTGEKARVSLPEGPFRSYVHSLQEPVILNGRGVRVEKEGKNNSTFEVWDEKFVKSYQCLGDEETLFQSGVDVRNCPHCEASTSYDRFRGPTPRYAVNVVKYNTKAGSWDVTSPFNASVLVWVFGPQKFQQIRDFATAGFDLRKHDLLLGPCEREDFQKYNMLTAQEAAWAANAESKKRYEETLSSNRVETEQLARIIAQELSKDVVQGYVDRVKRAWDIVNGVSVNNTDAILSAAEVGTPNFEPVPSPPATGSVDGSTNFDELLSGLID